MKGKLRHNLLALGLLTSFLAVSENALQAEYQLKKGRLVPKEQVAEFSAEEHYQLLLQAFHLQNWKEVFRQSNIIATNFPSFSQAHEVEFYRGVGYYHQGEGIVANEHLSTYLEKRILLPLPHFDEALQYKFLVAESFRQGEKKHLFGLQSAPKWLSAEKEALMIYDELIQTVDQGDLLAKALYSKGVLLAQMKRFEEAAVAFDSIIERFSKTEMGEQAYFTLAQMYFKQYQLEVHHPELLFLAENHYLDFKQAFPESREKQEQIRQWIEEMKEIKAENLCEVARFYERKKAPEAAAVYYKSILSQFPETKTALEIQNQEKL